MLSSRKMRWSLGGVVVVVLLAIAWCGWRVYRVEHELNDAVSAARHLKDDVQAGRTASYDKDLAAVRAASKKASDATSGPTWSVLTKIPFFGDDATGVRVASSALDDLARDGITPLTQVADKLDQLLPKDKRIDLTTVRGLQAPVGQAQAAFAKAQKTLAAQDSSGYVGQLREKFNDFRDDVTTADHAMTSAKITADLLPDVLGADHPTNYLLVFENNAELRATGGLPGAVAEVHADNGKLAITRQTSGAEIDGLSKTTYPISSAEKQQYGSVIGRYFRDANMTVDVPRAADLMRSHWEQAYPGDKIDGVVMLDTVTLSYVLDATGPITVDGVELTGDNVVDQLLHDTYLRIHSPAKQDAFFADVAAAAFDRFTTGMSNGSGVVKALARAASEHRVFVHSFDDAVQSKLAGTEVAGEFGTDPKSTAPQIAVTINDTTAAKMSYYLRSTTDVAATYCTSGVQGFTASARLSSTAPKDAAKLPAYITGGGKGGTWPGRQLLTYRIYGPVDGSIGKLMWNGTEMNLIRGTQDGRPWAMTYVELSPGQVVDLSWTMKSGKGQTGDTDVTVTPTIERRDSQLSVQSAC